MEKPIPFGQWIILFVCVGMRNINKLFKIKNEEDTSTLEKEIKGQLEK